MDFPRPDINSFGMTGLLCTARVHAFGPIDSEMERIVLTADLPTQWTYPQIQLKLLAELERRGVIQ